jgi:4'-phosphopantetheinyl transferase
MSPHLACNANPAAAATNPWLATSTTPPLQNFGAHVWRIQLSLAPHFTPSLLPCLSPAEQDRYARFHFAPDRERFVIRRAALRQILAAYLSIPPGEIEFVAGSYGKPEVNGLGGSAGLQFSCSHSGGLALVAVTRHQNVGVDIEQHRPLPDYFDLARSFFSPWEVAELQKIAPTLQQTAFFAGWTRKEAFVKALGLGLSYPLHRFTVSLAPDQPATLLQVDLDPSAVSRWTMRSLDILPEYSATLVAAGELTSLTCLEFQFPGVAASEK